MKKLKFSIVLAIMVILVLGVAATTVFAVVAPTNTAPTNPAYPLKAHYPRILEDTPVNYPYYKSDDLSQANQAQGYLINSYHGVTDGGSYEIYYDSDPSGKTITFSPLGCAMAIKTGWNLAVYVNGSATPTNLSSDKFCRTGDANIDQNFTIPVSAGGAAYKDSTTNLFKVTFTFKLSYTPPAPSTDPDVPTPPSALTGNYEYIVSYRLIAADGNIAAGNSENQQINGLGFANSGNDTNYYATGNFPFGVGCTENPGVKTITIYDPDNGTTHQAGNPVFARVYANGRPLDKSAYTVVSSASIKGSGANAYILPADNPSDGSSVKSKFSIYMTKGVKYDLRIEDVYQAPLGQAGSNYVGVSVPGSSAFGSDEVNCYWNVGTKTSNDDADAADADYGTGSIIAGSETTFTHEVGNYSRYGSTVDTQPITITANKTETVNGAVTPSSPFSEGTVVELDDTYSRDDKFTTSDDHTNRHTYCESVTAKAQNSLDPNSSETSPAKCVSTYWWQQSPSIVNNVGGVVESGSQIGVTGTIDNSGSSVPTPSDSTWEIDRVIYPPGVTPFTSGNGSNSFGGCDYWQKTDPGWTTKNDCDAISQGTGAVPLGSANDAAHTKYYADVIPDAPVGSRVCYSLSTGGVNASNTDNNANTNALCVQIGKKPKVQIHGSDLVVGLPFVGADATGSTRVVTSVSKKSIGGALLNFGSWVEYGLVSVGPVTGAGSGTAFNSTGGVAAGASSDIDRCNQAPLTFTNASADGSCGSSTAIGNYSNTNAFPDVKGYFDNSACVTVNPLDVHSACAAVGANVNLGAMTTGVYKDSTTGNITIDGGSLGANKWIVLDVPGATVTISHDITYTDDSFSSIREIPQLVIIASKINITGNVNRIDSWLIASTSIDTCSDAPAGGLLSAKVCKGTPSPSDCPDASATDCLGEPLTVNGPTMTKLLYLRRTAGAGDGTDNSGDPAEVFNLRPDAYIWANQRALSANSASASYTTELPPRF